MIRHDREKIHDESSVLDEARIVDDRICKLQEKVILAMQIFYWKSELLCQFFSLCFRR